MKIVSLKIKNYRCLQNIEINNLPAFCVLVGANGTGKSTFFDVFGFLSDALKNNVRQALQIRGGYREVVTRGHEKEDIHLEMQFRMTIVDKPRLVSYLLTIGQEKNKPVVKREILRYKRGSYGSPFHFLDAVDLNNIYWLEKHAGITKIYRAADNELLKNLVDEGDLPGYLWKQGLFGEANP
jgi:predicted ATPase